MRKGKTTLISLLIFILTLTSNVFAAGDSNTEPPTIYGKTAMTIDVETGEIIYAKILTSVCILLVLQNI
ncbi:hypothetical protein JTS93_09005 [Clostridium botulinum]|nr:hypothetical protein [Clostridium botulinum]